MVVAEPPPVRRVARVASQAEPKPEPAPIASDGPLDPEQAIRGALRLAQPAFELCYQSALKLDQRVKGRLVIELSVRSDGEVARARVVESTVTDDRVLSCIARRLRTMRLPAVTEDFDVTVPLSLVPRTS